MAKKLVTADGTETLFNEEFNEAYHSTKAGAYTESLHKFVNPTNIKKLAKEKETVRILDIGFGLGYNVATAYTESIKENPNVKLNIYSIEKDKYILDKIKLLKFPENLKPFYEKIKDIQEGSIFLSGNQYKVLTLKDKNIDLKIIIGEGRQIIKNLSKENLKFDVVFWDAFSPKVNTEMWTVNIFKLVKSLMEEDAVLATYSASLAVRKGLLQAGFKIGLVEPVGRKSYSTVATINGNIPSITYKEKKRLETSPYATPYEDNEDLTLSREQIKRNWEERLKSRL